MIDWASNASRLGAIGAAAALLLAVVNYFTEPVIESLHQAEVHATLKLFVGEGTPGPKEENPAPNVISRWPISPGRGWILEIVGKGYGGEMTIISAYDAEGGVIGAKLLDNNETVGFGKKAEKSSYMDVFVGKGTDTPIPLTKSDLGEQVDVISGATITFLGIAKAVSLGSSLVQEWGGE